MQIRNQLRIAVIFVMTWTAALLATAQVRLQQPTQTTPAAQASQAPIANKQGDQWEYLVISYGKTVFASPEKVLAYRQIGLSAIAQEANEVQRSLDILGRFGWEVITIVGTIGGDQQIVLKRRYDRARSQSEAIDILRGREVYLRDLLDILEREGRIREQFAVNKPRLVELDALELAQENERLSSERKKVLEGALPAALRSRAEVKAIATRSSTVIEVTFDGTQEFLKGGNSYRKSEIRSWIFENVLGPLRQASATFGTERISVVTTITFDGAPVRVDELRSVYSTALRRWDTY